MNCQQFQEALPQIIEGGGNEDEDAHLKSCAACSELVRDLEYIASQARLLLPMHDPSPQVWAGIEKSLQREGLLREGRPSRMGHVIALPAQARGWTSTGWIMAMAAVALFAAVLITYRPHPPAPEPVVQSVVTEPALDGEDQQVLGQLAQSEPAVRTAYETSLREVNAYIKDARQAVSHNPDDAMAQEHLADAYQQKEMLYQLATARSLP